MGELLRWREQAFDSGSPFCGDRVESHSQRAVTRRSVTVDDSNKTIRDLNAPWYSNKTVWVTPFFFLPRRGKISGGKADRIPPRLADSPLYPYSPAPPYVPCRRRLGFALRTSPGRRYRTTPSASALGCPHRRRGRADAWGLVAPRGRSGAAAPGGLIGGKQQARLHTE
ncbi:hypothetical protein PAHAL_1G041600 [Panicum hallii]|jgi:hypothetical protein|uniref:Uncharacterized protein n=1 Tax=Panicum hallii TaxID=206008 RepID=A0A2T8KTX7_9POAL|nr:hypothetical protein PAHAL_1G041600 [Panicum hallii]